MKYFEAEESTMSQNCKRFGYAWVKKFMVEWNNVCNKLNNSGADLSKIMLTCHDINPKGDYGAWE